LLLLYLKLGVPSERHWTHKSIIIFIQTTWIRNLIRSNFKLDIIILIVFVIAIKCDGSELFVSWCCSSYILLININLWQWLPRNSIRNIHFLNKLTDKYKQKRFYNKLSQPNDWSKAYLYYFNSSNWDSKYLIRLCNCFFSSKYCRFSSSYFLSLSLTFCCIICNWFRI
jgi:hypothetical protein